MLGLQYFLLPDHSNTLSPHNISTQGDQAQITLYAALALRTKNFFSEQSQLSCKIGGSVLLIDS